MTRTIVIDARFRIIAIYIILIIGLASTVIGFFGNFLKADMWLFGTLYASLSDLDADVEGFAATRIFAWTTFVLVIVSSVLFALARLLKSEAFGKVVVLFCCLTAASAILVFIFAIVMANKNSGGNAYASVKYTIAEGPTLMLTGGLLAGGAAAGGSLLQRDKKDVTIEEIHKEEYDKSGKSRV